MSNRLQDMDWKPLFLAMLVAEGTHTGAAREAGVSYRHVTRTMEKDPEFKRQAYLAKEMYIQRLEREADRRALEGVEKDIYFRGQVVGQERHFSDTLLIFRLKALRPDMYRDALVNVSASAHAEGGSFSQVVHVVPDAERRAEVAKILQDALGPGTHGEVTKLSSAPQLPPPES